MQQFKNKNSVQAIRNILGRDNYLRLLFIYCYFFSYNRIRIFFFTSHSFFYCLEASMVNRPEQFQNVIGARTTSKVLFFFLLCASSYFSKHTYFTTYKFKMEVCTRRTATSTFILLFHNTKYNTFYRIQ